MILIGENLNVASRKLGLALKERNPSSIIEVIKAEDATDIDYLEINLGPAFKSRSKMSWLVKNVLEVSDKPLSLNTSRIETLEAGLKFCKTKTLINSVSLPTNMIQPICSLIKPYNADMIGPLRGTDNIPGDASQRCVLAVDWVERANKYGIENKNIWIDIMATPVSGGKSKLRASFEFLNLLKEVAPECKPVVILSSVSQGIPFHLRPYINRTYLIMLLKYGVHAAVINAFDSELINIARGKKPGLVSMVHKMMDGEVPDLTSLSIEDSLYARTVRIINGESIKSRQCVSV